METQPSILALPKELTMQILQAVLHHRRKSLVNCLKVCRSWNDIGLTVLYKDLYLQEDSFAAGSSSRIELPFVGLVLNSPQLAVLIKSLTMQFWPDPIGIIISDRICWLLEELRCLKILSLTCCDTMPDFLYQIVSHTAPCLESLELRYEYDTDDLNEESMLRPCHHVASFRNTDPKPNYTGHLCRRTAPFLKKLRHLSLRTTSICHGLFSVAADDLSPWHLETVDIQFLCFAEQASLEAISDTENWSAPHALAEHMFNLIHAEDSRHLMPDLEHASVVTELYGLPRDKDSRYYPAYVRRDIMNGTTTVYPYRAANWFSRQEISNDSNAAGWIRAPANSGVEPYITLLSNSAQNLLRKISEPQSSWQTERYLKIRWPLPLASISDSRMVWWEDWSPMDPDDGTEGLLDQDLFMLEKAAGRPLLLPRTFKGLDKVGDCLRELAPAEEDGSDDLTS